MEIKGEIKNDLLVIKLVGRIDASNANEAEEKINTIIQESSVKDFIIDAEELEYISSAGLRVLLRLRKTVKELTVINVSNEIYNILDMTGFVELLTVKKAFRKLSGEGCEVIAQGAKGRVYRYDPETIVKVFYNHSPLEEINNERELCRKVFMKGINSAIPYDIVKVGEYYGNVAELLNAKSISKLIAKEPDKIEYYMHIFSDFLKRIHEVKATEEEFPSIKNEGLTWVKDIKGRISDTTWNKLYKLVSEIPVSQILIHGDYHTNNVMFDEEPILIDMDTVSVGHPIFDLVGVYSGFVGYSMFNPNNAIEFYGLTYDTTVKMWNLFLKDYFDNDQKAMDDAVMKVKILVAARIIRRVYKYHTEDTDEGRKFLEHHTKLLEETVDKVDKLYF